jgi:hypothetical protein
MCGPAAIIMAAGAAMSAMQQIQQGQAAKAQGKFQAAVAENNATAARQQAAFQEARQREEVERGLAAQRVRFGKSGALAAGSALDVSADRAVAGELAALSTRRSGELQAQSHGNQATLDRFKGSSAMDSAMLGAGSTLLMAASRVAPATFDELLPKRPTAKPGSGVVDDR